MNYTDIFEDSPNGYDITSQAPKKIEDAIKYYFTQIDKFPISLHPLEYAVANYGLAKALLKDKTKLAVSELRAKRVENALYHFNLSLQVFTRADYPVMFAIVSVMMGHMFRERATLISDRSFLSARSTPEDSLEYGIDQLLDAIPVISLARVHTFEHAICCLEMGWLYVLLSEFLDNVKDELLREQALTYLDRTVSLAQTLMEPGFGDTLQGRKGAIDVMDHKTYPSHLRALMDDKTPAFLEGSALYLMGRLYQGWLPPSLDDRLAMERRITSMQSPLQFQEQAFKHFCRCVRPKFLPQDSPLWGDGHHRAALVVVKHPQVVDPDFDDSPASAYSNPRLKPQNSDLHLEVAISHLNLGLRCKGLTNPAAMDIHFHLAQALIARLQMIIDTVPQGASVTKTIAAGEGIDIIQQVEVHLREARLRVTAANNQSTQDAYLHFFSSLKISEYRMLEAACKPDLTSTEREEHLRDSVDFLVDAMIARPVGDNLDLHYTANNQLYQTLQSVRRPYAATKACGKAALVLSALLNRAQFSPEHTSKLFSDEIEKLTSNAILAGCRSVPWVKLHFGPRTLHEKVTAGYASWAFEDLPIFPWGKKKPPENNSLGPAPVGNNAVAGGSEGGHRLDSFRDGSVVSLDDSQVTSALMTPNVPVTYSSPPKGVPPLKLPAPKNKRVLLNGEVMAAGSPGVAFPGQTQGEGGKSQKLPPPGGAVPLFAMGHSPEEEDEIDPEDPFVPHYFYSGPYGRRLRRRIPPGKEMREIDHKNMSAFGQTKGKVFLLPSHTGPTRPIKEEEEYTDDDEYDDEEYEDDDEEVSDLEEEEEEEKQSEGGTHYREEKSDAHHDSDEDIHDGNDGRFGGEGGALDGKPPARPRSQKIRVSPRNTSMGPADESKKPPAEPKKDLGQTKGLVSWILGRKKKEEKVDKAAAVRTAVMKPVKQKRSLFGLGKKKGVPVVEPLRERCGMWASSGQSFYCLMVLSRHSRLRLIHRTQELQVVRGERASSTLFRMKSRYLTTFHSIKRKLIKECASLIAPPFTLKDLSQRSFLELQRLFHSQIKIGRKLEELEFFLYHKISKVDYFLPMVTAAPALLRDLAAFDAALLDSNRLKLNLTFEDALLHQRATEAARAAHGGESTLGMKKMGANANVSVAEFTSSSVTAGPSKAHLHAGFGPEVLRDVRSGQRQEEEEKEEVQVGKMTLSLSQALDGAGYLRGGQQGSRDMLEKFLADDECLMTWHVPHAPNQPLQVVLVWRGDSASLHSHYTSTETKAMLLQSQQGKGNKGGAPVDLLDDPEDVYKPKNRGKGKTRSKSKGKSSADKKGSPADVGRGIVVEMAKSDLDVSHLLLYVQNYIDALHARPAPRRATLCTDALRSLSCALSITELLRMIPPHVTSLCVCCPPTMRLVPWHLLLIEVPAPEAPPGSGLDGTHNSSSASLKGLGGPQVKEIHLLEKYQVRIGPTLSLFELVSTASSRMRHSTGMHRLCAVDGEANAPLTRHNRKQVSVFGPSRVPGVRGTDLEVACCAHTWSADPEDSHILQDEAAAPQALQTGLFGYTGDLTEYLNFKREVHLSLGKRVNHIEVSLEEAEEQLHTRLEREAQHILRRREREEQNRSLLGMADDLTLTASHQSQTLSPSLARNDTLSPTKIGLSVQFSSKYLGKEGQQDEDGDSSLDDSDSEEDEEEQQETLRFNQMSLTMCRVLHLSAAKQALHQTPAASVAQTQAESFRPAETGLALPLYHVNKVSEAQRKHGKEGGRALGPKEVEEVEDELKGGIEELTRLSASDVIKQLHLRNCALCVVSRFALTDDITEVRPMPLPTAAPAATPDGNCEFVEALHLSGVTTCLYPLWGGPTGQGQGTFVNLLFLIRFYSTLPAASRHRLSVVETCRRTQLWLKDATADDIIAFIHKAPLPRKAKELIIEEMNSYVAASLSPSKGGKTASPGADSQQAGESETVGAGGNRVGGNRKFFTHFLHWGSFAVSGHGGNVHHPDLTEDLEGLTAIDGAHAIKWDDEELNNIAFEASVLRMEGKIKEAKILEKIIRRKRLEQLRRRLAAARGAGARAGRGIMDSLHFLDKALLDQDSDEVSVSDDSAEEERRRQARLTPNMPRFSDSEDSEEEKRDLALFEGESAKTGPGESGKDRKLVRTASQTRPGSANPRGRKKPLALDLLKPEDIAYEKWKSKVGGLTMNVRNPKLPPRKVAVMDATTTPANPDDYEFSLLKSVKQHESQSPPPEQELAQRDLERAAQKEREKKKAEKEKRKQEKILEYQRQVREREEEEQAERRLAELEAEMDEESDYSDSDGSEGDKDYYIDEWGVKRRKRKKKKEGRFWRAFKDVKSNVRSYSQVVKAVATLPQHALPSTHSRVAVDRYTPEEKTGSPGEKRSGARAVEDPDLLDHQLEQAEREHRRGQGQGKGEEGCVTS